MNNYRDLYTELCSYDNLEFAFKKARKHKTTKDYVIKFEKNLKNNLLQLRTDLLFHSYRPKPLQSFILRDPKTRKISKSDFRDRVIHHTLCNIIEPILEKRFIYDSYANRIGKGTLKAIERFEWFKRKVSQNFTKQNNYNNIKGFVLKCDIRNFFDSIDHKILLNIIKKTIKDKRIIWLIKIILDNYNTKIKGVGMPLGNLTSQFFANVYLNGLDYFIKHKLKVKYYIRYVDDFVILHRSKEKLEEYKARINYFLEDKLSLQLHVDKSRIFPLFRGTTFLGLRLFNHNKLLKKVNVNKFKRKLLHLLQQYDKDLIDYDDVYDFLEGWIAYAKHADTYNLRKKLLKPLDNKFLTQISTKEINRGLRKK